MSLTSVSGTDSTVTNDTQSLVTTSEANESSATPKTTDTQRSTSTDQSGLDTVGTSTDSQSQDATTESSGDTGTPGDTSTKSQTDTTASDTSTSHAECTWSENVNSCPPGYFCESPTCGVGKCVQLEVAIELMQAPVCGCDNVTYWNRDVARNFGASVASAGVCESPKTCGGISGETCSNGAVCYGERDAENACSLDIPSTCWRLPADCPENDEAVARSCGGGDCTSICKAVRAGAWYMDGDCVP